MSDLMDSLGAALGPEARPTSRGRVTLIEPEDAEASGTEIRGPFDGRELDLGTVDIRILNRFRRFLIPCRVDYPLEQDLPSRHYVFPVPRIDAGYLRNPRVVDATIDFESAELERVNLILFGPGYRSDESSPCVTNEERHLVYARVYVDAFIALIGWVPGFESWLMRNMAEFGLSMFEAVQARNEAEYIRIVRHAMIRFLTEAPNVGIDVVKTLQVVPKVIDVINTVEVLGTMHMAPEVVTYALVAERYDLPGDDEGDWELAWIDPDDGSATSRFFSYGYSAAQQLDQQTLGLLFDPAGGPPGEIPHAMVTIYQIGDIALEERTECRTIINFGGGESGLLMSPVQAEETFRTYVTLTELEMPFGVTPGLVSGYLEGALGIVDASDWTVTWTEVRIIEASFDSVAVYPPVGACCFDEVCDVLRERECEDTGGLYMGDGTICGPGVCSPR